MERQDFLEKAVLSGTISQRSFSDVHLYNYAGKLFVFKRMRPNGPNNEVTREILEKSFGYYKALQSTKGLVIIHAGWWDEKAGCFCTVMDYLNGYKRLVDGWLQLPESTLTHLCYEAFEAMANMMAQGFADYDFDVTNVMYNPTTLDLKLIDLDKIMPLREVCKDRSHYGSWFASRMARLMRLSQGIYQPQEQFTSVEKINAQ